MSPEKISGICAAPPDETVDLVLYLGQTLYRFGASAQRIIDSMQVLNHHFGGSRYAFWSTQMRSW